MSKEHAKPSVTLHILRLNKNRTKKRKERKFFRLSGLYAPHFVTCYIFFLSLVCSSPQSCFFFHRGLSNFASTEPASLWQVWLSGTKHYQHHRPIANTISFWSSMEKNSKHSLLPIELHRISSCRQTEKANGYCGCLQKDLILWHQWTRKWTKAWATILFSFRRATATKTNTLPLNPNI